MHRVYLVPGFFGFTNLGEFRYFAHVQEFLATTLAARGVAAEIVVVPTEPTSSLPRRATRLVERIAADGDDGPVHLIGHSSGGLDARLAVSPGVRLPTALDVERLARRVRTVVTVSTPHHGTPLASFFTGIAGAKLLQALSLTAIVALRLGRLPMAVLARLGAAFARLDRGGGPSSTLLDELFGQLLADLSPERRDAIAGFLAEVERDRALLPQITPAGLDLFNASARDRPTVRYGSVLSMARRPGVGSTLAAGLDPAAQATHALYAALYRLTASTEREHLPHPTREEARLLRRFYGALPAPGANDGVVPTRAQLWGTIVHGARGDHLDVIGHFGDPSHVPPHFDWLTTGSGFDRSRFEALWRAVVSYLVAG